MINKGFKRNFEKLLKYKTETKCSKWREKKIIQIFCVRKQEAVQCEADVIYRFIQISICKITEKILFCKKLDCLEVRETYWCEFQAHLFTIIK